MLPVDRLRSKARQIVGTSSNILGKYAVILIQTEGKVSILGRLGLLAPEFFNGDRIGVDGPSNTMSQLQVLD